MAKRAPTVSAERKRRIRRIHGLRSQGLTSPQIAHRLGLAPSTVRDYINDPFRQRARKRQRRWGVVGVTMPAGGTPIDYVKGTWKRGAPHEGVSLRDAEIRGRQLRAVIGSQARRARRG